MTHHCPTHGDTMRWSEAKFGYRGQCSAPGCTVACWDRPTSLPGDRETRDMRMLCHAGFDPLWQDGHFPSRSAAYRWLAAALGLPPHLAHIGMLTKTQAEALMVRIEAKWDEIEKKQVPA